MDMAGDFAVAQTVGLGALDPLWNAGLELDILVDLSHNANFPTLSKGTQVMAKGIEIDMRVSRGTVTSEAWTALLSSATGATKEIVDGVEALGGVDRLDQAAVKVEIPSFGADIFDPGSADGEAAIAVEVCTAQPAAFDAIEDWKRQYFGMYRWGASGLTALGYEEEPRTRAG
jgi:hypothetical protein